MIALSELQAHRPVLRDFLASAAINAANISSRTGPTGSASAASPGAAEKVQAGSGGGGGTREEKVAAAFADGKGLSKVISRLQKLRVLPAPPELLEQLDSSCSSIAGGSTSGGSGSYGIYRLCAGCLATSTSY